MTHLHFGVCLLFSSACDRWLQDATTGHGAPLEEGSAENLVFKADRKSSLIHALLLDAYQDGPANSSYAEPLVDEIPSDTRTSGLCGASTKTSNQTL
jgi:hypothetical protein